MAGNSRAVSSRVVINRLRVQQLDQAAITALEKTTEYLHTEIVQDQVIPRDTGTMQNEKFFPDYSMSSEGKTKLVVEGPYARRLYYHPEYNFQKTENPNAKGKWYEDYMPDGKRGNIVPEKFKEIFRRLAGL